MHPTEVVARALIRDAGLDPDVFKGIHGSHEHFADTAADVVEALITSGFLIVPIQPTEKMIDEGYDSYDANGGSLLDVYRDMIQAYDPTAA